MSMDTPNFSEIEAAIYKTLFDGYIEIDLERSSSFIGNNSQLCSEIATEAAIAVANLFNIEHPRST